MKRKIPSFESVILRKQSRDSQRSGNLFAHLLANHVYRCTGAAHGQRNGTDRVRTVTKILAGRFLLTGLFLAGMVTTSVAQEPQFDWAKKAGGSGFDVGQGIATDASGNSFVAGQYTNSGSFGTTLLPSFGDADAFIAKLDNTGNFLWARHAGGNGPDGALAIAVDALGNSYVSGYFWVSAIFGSTTLTAGPQTSNLFITTLDADGNFLWAVSAVSTGTDPSAAGTGIALDADGNVYVTGEFSSSLQFGNTVLESAGSTDIFVAKFDGVGHFQWAKRAGGTEHDSGSAVATGPNDKLYIAGNFEGAGTFGNAVLTSQGPFDAFIACLDMAGNFLWAVKVGGSGVDYINCIVADAGGVYTCGDFEGSAAFGATTLTSQGAGDAFIARLDGVGDFLWATRAGGATYDRARGIATGPDGSLYVVGGFDGTATYGNSMLTSQGNLDVFIAKMDQAGTFQWAERAGGTANDGALSVAVDANGDLRVTGWINASATFGTTVLTSSGGWDAFITKVSGTDSTVGEGEASSEDHGIQVLPNPARDRIELVAQDLPSMELLITDAAGKPVLRTRATETSTSVDISHLAPGIYLLKVRMGKGEVVKRFVKE